MTWTMDRRELLKRGAGGALALLWGGRVGWAQTSRRRLLQVWLDGGPSHLETFDPKPGTATGGPTRGIDTSLAGVQFAEHLPGLARRAERFAVVRSLTSREGDHARADHLVHTGYSPSQTVAYPTWGSVVSAELGACGGDVPAFVRLGEGRVGAGYLGSAHAPYGVTELGVGLGGRGDVGAERRAERRALLGELEAGFAERVGGDPRRRVEALEGAEAVLRGPLEGALTASAEGRYGSGEYAERCACARRLLEAGVRGVEVVLGGWDDHQELFAQLPERAARLDRALSALVDDLVASGLWEETVVVVCGEFGRTPTINGRGGRDHHPQAFSGLLGGAGIAAGQVLGATDAEGREVVEHPVTVPEWWATCAAALEVDGAAWRYAGARPVQVVDGAAPVAALLR